MFDFSFRFGWLPLKWRLLTFRIYRIPHLNKVFEWQINRTPSWITFEVSWSIKTDHAGVELAASVFSWEGILHFYDMRHWDHEKGEWK